MQAHPPAPFRFIRITKRFGTAEALSAVTLEGRAGELTVLLGPNGAGKSTLVQVATGLVVPDEGSVEIGGVDLRQSAPTALAQLGIVFQQQTLDPELTVLGNLRFHADLHGLPAGAAEPRIEELLGWMDLAGRAGDRVASLSGGNRRRVELVRALLHRPRLLIMDEPTAGLDPGTRRELLHHVRELARLEGLAAIWTTHLLDEAEAADRLAVLQRGKLVFDGDLPGFLAMGDGNADDAYFHLVGESATSNPE